LEIHTRDNVLVNFDKVMAQQWLANGGDTTGTD
jgi:hypothetical protein